MKFTAYGYEYYSKATYTGEPQEPEVEEHELSAFSSDSYFIPDADNKPAALQLISGKSYNLWLTISDDDTKRFNYFMDYLQSPHSTSDYISNIKVTINGDDYNNFTLVSVLIGLKFDSADLKSNTKAGDVLSITFDVMQSVNITPVCTTVS